MHNSFCRCLDCQIFKTEQALGVLPVEKSQTNNFAYLFIGIAAYLIITASEPSVAAIKSNPAIIDSISTVAIIDLDINEFLKLTIHSGDTIEDKTLDKPFIKIDKDGKVIGFGGRDHILYLLENEKNKIRVSIIKDGKHNVRGYGSTFIDKSLTPRSIKSVATETKIW